MAQPTAADSSRSHATVAPAIVSASETASIENPVVNISGSTIRSV